MSLNLSSIDKLSASDALVIYSRNGAVRKGTVGVLMDYVQSKIEPSITPEIYDTDSYIEQTDATYIYFAWARIDGMGYIAERRNLSTGQAAGSTTSTGAIPADLTALTYS